MIVTSGKSYIQEICCFQDGCDNSYYEEYVIVDNKHVCVATALGWTFNKYGEACCPECAKEMK